MALNDRACDASEAQLVLHRRFRMTKLDASVISFDINQKDRK